MNCPYCDRKLVYTGRSVLHPERICSKCGIMWGKMQTWTKVENKWRVVPIRALLIVEDTEELNENLSLL
jgi:hypothetical protein